MFERMTIEDKSTIVLDDESCSTELWVTVQFGECDHFSFIKDNFLDNDEVDFYLTKKEARALAQKLLEFAESEVKFEQPDFENSIVLSIDDAEKLYSMAEYFKDGYEGTSHYTEDDERFLQMIKQRIEQAEKENGNGKKDAKSTTQST